jgi:hypothetical protein
VSFITYYLALNLGHSLIFNIVDLLAIIDLSILGAASFEPIGFDQVRNAVQGLDNENKLENKILSLSLI